ncbi:amino acid efflux transporter [Rhodococcus sp. 27YEA15]|uniref:APC family permease n=1 Tax=Rhodococcus sp. 27YEA15 TaxID=3156259 RepID=UPI003C7B90B5
MSRGLGVAEGSALYIAAVLGTGILVLPSVAIAKAGPGALLALVALLVLSVPLASAFAALGSRHPDSGGVGTYVRRAFGAGASTVTSWWFYLGVPIGVPALVLFGAGYLETVVGGGRDGTFVIAGVLLAVCVAANVFGVKFSGRVQLGLTALLVLGLFSAVIFSQSPSGAVQFEQFLPFGWSAVVPAALVLVWSLTGWEAVTHLAGEFRNPARDIRRATAVALVVISCLFVLVTVTMLVVLGTSVASTNAPIAALVEGRLGRGAVIGTAALAVIITLGGTNAYLASLSKLGAAMGRDGSGPKWLAHGASAGSVARRSLAVMTAYSAALLAVAWFAGWNATDLVLVCTASQIAVYVIGLVAALRLLPARGFGWWCALLSLIVMSALLVLTGWNLLAPTLTAVAALGYHRLRQRRESTFAGSLAVDADRPTGVGR